MVSVPRTVFQPSNIRCKLLRSRIARCRTTGIFQERPTFVQTVLTFLHYFLFIDDFIDRNVFKRNIFLRDHVIQIGSHDTDPTLKPYS